MKSQTRNTLIAAGFLALQVVVPSAMATDVAFIVNNVGLTNQGDVVVNDLLVSRGFNVTLVSQNEDATTTLEAADAADLVIVSESVGSGNVNTEVVESTSPILLYEAYLYDDFAWTGGTISNDFAAGDDGGNTPPDMTDSITIVQPDHPLAAGLPAGDVPVYTAPGRIAWGNVSSGATVVATLPGEPDAATIFVYEAGALDRDGFPVPARRVGLFPSGLTLTDSELTEEGLGLFNSALNFVLGLDITRGDFNADGAIDLVDFNILVDNFRSGTTFAEGDNNLDGDVDLQDFVEFRALFNDPGVAAAVPEPGSLLLLASAVPWLVLRRRRATGRPRDDKRF